ncbi:hypothetical protein [Brochothrix thermosphacta]|uniref:hypothetical protein n=1 Tax=Brochothrix thermosphacta TaxID=2756 RepID=UPI003F9C8A5D
MKNKIILVLAIVGLFVFVYLTTQLGIKSDEMTFNSYMSYYSYAVFALGFISMLTIILMLFHLFNKKIVYISLTIVISMLLLFTVLMPPKYDAILKEQLEKIETQNIKEITWDEVKELEKKSDHNRLVYVGREDCPTCQKFKPEIAAVAYNNDFIVYYYNTTKDRQEADFDDKIKHLKIDRVPSVLIVGKGKVTNITDKIKDSEELDAKFEYLDENKGKLFK